MVGKFAEDPFKSQEFIFDEGSRIVDFRLNKMDEGFLEYTFGVIPDREVGDLHAFVFNNVVPLIMQRQDMFADLDRIGCVVMQGDTGKFNFSVTITCPNDFDRNGTNPVTLRIGSDMAVNSMMALDGVSDAIGK